MSAIGCAARSHVFRCDDLFTTKRFPTASVRQCLLCKHSEVYRYTGGHRGAGMVGGNKARGRMIQHIKSAHPEAYAAARMTHYKEFTATLP